MADRSNDLEDLRQRKRGAIEVQGPDGKTRTVNLKDLANAYSSLAGRCGYKPVFKREFGSLATFSFAVSVSGLFSTFITTFSYPLYAGGASSTVWCRVISGFGCMCIAGSVAELVSAYPTCGGMYYTV